MGKKNNALWRRVILSKYKGKDGGGFQKESLVIGCRVFGLCDTPIPRCQIRLSGSSVVILSLGICLLLVGQHFKKVWVSQRVRKAVFSFGSMIGWGWPFMSFIS